MRRTVARTRRARRCAGWPTIPPPCARRSPGQPRASSAIRRRSISVLARFEDGDPMVRQIALIAAAEIGDAARPRPAEARPRGRARRRALPSRGVAGDAGAGRRREPLSQRVVDDDPEVRAHLADALGRAGAARGRPSAGPPARGRDAARFAEPAAVGAGADRRRTRSAGALIDALSDDERCFEAAWGSASWASEKRSSRWRGCANAFLKPLAFKAAAAAALVRLGDRRGGRGAARRARGAAIGRAELRGAAGRRARARRARPTTSSRPARRREAPIRWWWPRALASSRRRARRRAGARSRRWPGAGPTRPAPVPREDALLGETVTEA